MNRTIQNIVSVLAGIIIGSTVNMGIIHLSSSIIPLPAGADNSTLEGLRESIHLYSPKHFLFPFLAHALGTFLGACMAAGLSRTRKITRAMIVGILFLIGGIINAFMLPAPGWFIWVDLIFAYIPVSYLAGKIFSRHSEVVR
jgi:hypothetical protein